MKFFTMYLVIISKLILLWPHRVVAHSRHKSSGIKPSFGWTSAKGVEKSDSPLVTLQPKPYQQQLLMRHYSRFPLKPTSWFQPADDIWTLSASRPKSLFSTTPKVFSNTSWDGTMQQTRPPASQSNRANSECLTEYPLRRYQQLPSCTVYQSCTSDHFPAEAATSPTPATTIPAPGTTSSSPAVSSPEPATTYPTTTSLVPATQSCTND